MQKITLFSLLIILVTTLACNNDDKLITPIWSDCPFRELNFSQSNESDSLSKTISINDTLIAGLKADLTKLQSEGKVGNSLVMSINSLKSSSRQSSFAVTQEYFEMYNKKTAPICGLVEILKNNKTFTTADARARAESLLLDLVAGFEDFSAKKKALN